MTPPRARCPEAVAVASGGAGQLPEAPLEAHVRRHHERHGVAGPQQLGVDERATRTHVGQQAAVAVALLDVELEHDVAVADEALVERPRALRVTLRRRGGLIGLGRVDADVAHALDLPGGQPHADRVAVADREHAAADPAIRGAFPRLIPARGQRGGRERARGRRAQAQTRASDSASSYTLTKRR
ncbi:MAG TPA: hypothetical protein VEY49_07420 [Solirubrobacteraceae bacterium]|nr:hypothetical protein [Solirubrobacteraceae bacterium]